MTTEEKIRRILAIALEALKESPERLNEVERIINTGSGSDFPTRKSFTPRNRRKPALFDPFVVIAEGEPALRDRLHQLDTEALKDIVAEFGMDPGKLALKWKSKDRLTQHIVTTVQSRSRKGDAFRS